MGEQGKEDTPAFRSRSVPLPDARSHRQNILGNSLGTAEQRTSRFIRRCRRAGGGAARGSEQHLAPIGQGGAEKNLSVVVDVGPAGEERGGAILRVERFDHAAVGKR